MHLNFHVSMVYKQMYQAKIYTLCDMLIDGNTFHILTKQNCLGDYQQNFTHTDLLNTKKIGAIFETI